MIKKNFLWGLAYAKGKQKNQLKCGGMEDPYIYRSHARATERRKVYEHYRGELKVVRLDLTKEWEIEQW